ncbi:MAG: hypothetical protein RXR31_01890 [Thermoproteota archaeon]
MMRYEQVLNKISPLFYKLTWYHGFTVDHTELVKSYLTHINIPDEYDLVFVPLSSKYYCFLYSSIQVKYGLGIKSLDIKSIKLKEKEVGIDEETLAYADEIIINTIINRFSYEYEYIDEELELTYKKFVTALVGRDLYEAIRTNIR